MKYAAFDEAGFPLAFFADDIHGPRLIKDEPNPDCMIPVGAVEITEEQWGEFLANPGRRRWLGDEVVPYDPPVPPPPIDDYRRAIQAHVDATAQQRSYDSGITCASYVGSTNPAWAAEAQAFVSWRDAVWAHVYEALAAVQAGERAQPSIADLIGELPAIDWPAEPT